MHLSGNGKRMDPAVLPSGPDFNDAARLLQAQNLLTSGCQSGRSAFYVSDSVDGFNQIADIFLGEDTDHSASRINIEEY